MNNSKDFQKLILTIEKNNQKEKKIKTINKFIFYISIFLFLISLFSSLFSSSFRKKENLDLNPYLFNIQN